MMLMVNKASLLLRQEAEAEREEDSEEGASEKSFVEDKETGGLAAVVSVEFQEIIPSGIID